MRHIYRLGDETFPVRVLRRIESGRYEVRVEGLEYDGAGHRVWVNPRYTDMLWSPRQLVEAENNRHAV